MSDKGMIRTDYKHPENVNRRESKKARGFGQLAMKEAKMSQSQWTAKHDPLFNIKGKERWEKTHSM